MPRRLRLDLPGVPVHVTDRGDEGRSLFVTEDDRAFVVRRAAEVFADAGASCLAFAIMTNHWHFFVVPGEEPLARAMSRLKTSVARRYRALHGERGHVFQGRYHTNCLARRRRNGRADEAALPAVLLYVLLNPHKAGITRTIEELAAWPWTSLPDLIGLRTPVLTDVPRALGLLGGDDVATRRWVVEALAAQIADSALGARGTQDGLPAQVSVPVRASADAEMREGQSAATGPAVASELAAAPPGPGTAAWRRRRLRRAALEALGWTPDDLVTASCARLGADANCVRLGGRSDAQCAARAVAIAAGCDLLAATLTEMARATGVGVSAAAAARARGRALLVRLAIDPETLIPGRTDGGVRQLG